MLLNLEAPLNSLSFGNCSINILFELYKKKFSPNIFQIGQPDVESFRSCFPEEFFRWIAFCSNGAVEKHKRDIPTLKLWHLNGSLTSLSKEQFLFSFYELDSPTKAELNIAKNQEKVFFSSNLARESFSNYCDNIEYVPLGFDFNSFKKSSRLAKKQDVITFGLAGKLEKRKQHHKVLKAWAFKYGNNPKYALNCAITNPFVKPESFQRSIASILDKNYFNINFVPFMATNDLYNDYLNYNDIIIGMSSGEGWGLPEFQSVCLGKHSVILNAHAYKDWANEKTSVLVDPMPDKIECYDNVFFQKGSPFNQGNYYDWEMEDFISACEKAVKRFEKNKTNKEGEKLKDIFTWEKTTDKILSIIEKNA